MMSLFQSLGIRMTFWRLRSVQDVIFLEREYDRIGDKSEGRIGHRENVETDLSFAEEAQRGGSMKAEQGMIQNSIIRSQNNRR
jgi:hypothetical protein